MRRCGECRECCVVMAISEINKPANEACPHLCAVGCGIYKNRPGECAKFNCMWLMKILPAWMRPNKVHAVVWPGQVTNDTGQPMPTIRVNFNDAFPRSSRVLRWAERVSEKYLVILNKGNRFQAFFKGKYIDCGGHGDTWMFTVENGQLQHVKITRAVESA